MKKTALHDTHVELGGKIIEFFGFQLPVHYTTIMDEHLAVRRSVGLFDVSHMGNFIITGPNAQEFLNHVLTNNMMKLKPGELKYAHILNDDGKIIDDMITAGLEPEKYFSVPNASMIDRDYEWFTTHTGDRDVKVENVSDEYSILALQGQNARKVLRKLTDYDLKSLEFFQCAYMKLKDIEEEILIWRSGYTGEDGFELMVPNPLAHQAWDSLIAEGQEFDIKPIGLGARDTLRLEKGFLLSGQDFHEDRTSLETNWNGEWAINWDTDFIGKEPMQAQKDKGGYDLFCGIQLDDFKSGVPRPGHKILQGGEQVGDITSGTAIPTLDGKKIGFALGYVKPELAKAGTKLDIEIRNKPVPGTVAKLP
ncbi:MAG: glycine cleavage system aminomethyltransferase GcvT [Thermoplasmata archaeon]|nr:MAG: glycine cleavage system aminomethyltransferase GcvT [Thermoplasmata archaeon]